MWLSYARICQNQDSRDYRIFRILSSWRGFRLWRKAQDGRSEILKILILTEEGRPRFSLGFGWRARPPMTRAGARDTLILAFSRKGGRDLSLAVLAWLHVAGLDSRLWIPAFAGMTGVVVGNERFVARDSRLISGGALGFVPLDSRFRGNDGARGRE